MKVRNVDSLAKEQLYYCYDANTHDFLYNSKKINYIYKDVDKQGKEYYVYFKSILLKKALDELGV